MAGSGDLAVATACQSAQRVSGAGAVFVYSLDGSLCGSLTSPREFSWGKQRLVLDRGPEHAGHAYRFLGSMSGTLRGVRYRATRIPLNLDPYFVALLRTPQLGLFQTTERSTATAARSSCSRCRPTSTPTSSG